MTDRPILFSGPMVLALLGGLKTQTRRLLRESNTYEVEKPRIAVGDRLYVRESLQKFGADPGTAQYVADITGVPHRRVVDGTVNGRALWQWKRPTLPSIHMPRWASRLTLTVTDVRVQRLMEISQMDAVAEGAPIDRQYHDMTQDQSAPPMVAREHGAGHVTVRGWYHELWDSLNKERAPWSTNPWVVAYTFTVHQGNIDEAAKERTT